MDDFKKHLKQRLSHYGIAKQYDASVICKEAEKASDGRFEPISYRSGTLKVRVPNTSRAHLVRLQEEEIVCKINELLGEEKVKRLRFEIGE